MVKKKGERKGKYAYGVKENVGMGRCKRSEGVEVRGERWRME